MSVVVLASAGLVVAGPLGAVGGALGALAWPRLRRRAQTDPPMSVVMLLILIGLRSGLSVLGALVETASYLPHYRNLQQVARLARVSGLVAALPHADEQLRPVLAHLARAQRTGASLTGTVRRMMESRLAADQTAKIARARTLPVRLMLPVTLLMLPGLVLVLYAPALIEMFSTLTGVLE